MRVHHETGEGTLTEKQLYYATATLHHHRGRVVFAHAAFGFSFLLHQSCLDEDLQRGGRGSDPVCSAKELKSLQPWNTSSYIQHR